MAAQERIIGGGFLIIGVAIVLVLIYFFTFGGQDATQAYEEILTEHFPAYEAAAQEGDYIALKAAAQRVQDALDNTVKKHIAAEATSGRGAVQRLHKLVTEDAFEKNTEGLFGYNGSWFTEQTHRALGNLERTLKDDLKVLARLRDTAQEARAAIEFAARGSKSEIALPAAAAVQDDAPIMDPNPLYVHDGELFRVFGVDPAKLKAALATEINETGTKAWVARKNWNEKIVGSGLGQRVSSVPEQLDALRKTSNEVNLAARILANDPKAEEAAAALLKAAAIALGKGVGGDQKATYRDNLDKFARGAAIANVLMSETRLMKAYLPTIRELGATLDTKFK